MPECTGCCRCSGVCIAVRLGGADPGPVHLRQRIFACAGCWRCLRACPEGVDVYSESMRTRRERELPESYRRALENIRATGIALPVRELNALREMHGLPPVRLPAKAVLRVLTSE